MKPILKHPQCINPLNAPVNFGLSPSDHQSQRYGLLLPPTSLTGLHKTAAKGLLCSYNPKELLTLTSTLVITWAGSAKAVNSDWYSFAAVICSGGRHPQHVSLFLELNSITSASAMRPKPLFKSRVELFLHIICCLE